jgi:hypothetical protein
MIWEFEELSQKYADTELGREAARLAAGEPRDKPKAKRPQQQQQQQRQQPAGDSATVSPQDDIDSEWPDTLTEAQIEQLRLEKILEELPLAPEQPTVEPEFEYPLSAYGDPVERSFMTKIKIEFDGRVTEVELLQSSDQEDIDMEIRRVLLQTEFDPMEIEPLHIGGYFIYYYEVIPPDAIRQRN